MRLKNVVNSVPGPGHYDEKLDTSKGITMSPKLKNSSTSPVPGPGVNYIFIIGLLKLEIRLLILA